MMCFSFLCRVHVALNIKKWLCLYYVDKINRVNRLIFIFIIFTMKDHTVQSVLKTASKVIFSSPLLQAAWLKAHWSGKRVTHFSELGVSSLSLLHSPGAKQQWLRGYFWDVFCVCCNWCDLPGSHGPRCCSVFQWSSWPKQMCVTNKWFGEAAFCCYLKIGVKTALP